MREGQNMRNDEEATTPGQRKYDQMERERRRDEYLAHHERERSKREKAEELGRAINIIIDQEPSKR
jgi:hypothetical protein